MNEQKTKPWYQSSTILLNGLAAAIEIMNAIDAFAIDPTTKGFLPNGAHIWLGIGLTVGNILLRRYKTTTAIR